MNPTPTPLPDIRDIVPPHGFVLPVQYLWYILAALAVFVLGWLAAVYLRRARRIAPLTPRQVAAMRLQDLQRRIEETDPRTFGGEVCDVLRAYIGSEYGLHAQRQTSEEFINTISSSTVFQPAEHKLLQEFLQHCDLLKFARYDATLPAKQGLLDQAANFLENTGVPPVTAPLSTAPTPLPTMAVTGQ